MSAGITLAGIFFMMDNINYPFVYLGWQMNEDVNPMLYTYSEWKERMASPFFQNVERDKLQLA